MFAAPGKSRAIISHEQLSNLKRKDDLSSTTGEKQLPSDDIMGSTAETKVKGEELSFSGLLLAFMKLYSRHLSNLSYNSQIR